MTESFREDPTKDVLRAEGVSDLESEHYNELTSKIEASPIFGRLCGVLVLFQDLVQHEENQTKREEMRGRFAALYLVGLEYNPQEMSEVFGDAYAAERERVINEAEESAYFGKFTAQDFARQISLALNGELATMLLVHWERAAESTEGEWQGKVLNTDFFEEDGKRIMELHIHPPSELNPVELMRLIKHDIADLKDALIKKEYACDMVRMESWLLSKKLERVLRSILGRRIVDRIEIENIDPVSLLDDETQWKRKLILSEAISFNPNCARDWIVEGILPEIGKVEIEKNLFLDSISS